MALFSSLKKEAAGFFSETELLNLERHISETNTPVG
jgi:hypothetical protein